MASGERLADVIPIGQPADLGGVSRWVDGVPAPQGSMAAMTTPSGRAYVVPGGSFAAKKRLKDWREAVRAAFVDADMVEAPVAVTVSFWMPRPKSRPHDKHHAVRPDIDKLLRATFDALTDSGVIEDDARIADVRCVKRYAEDDATGAWITIGEMTT